MTMAIAPRSRKVRILATLGPASSTPEMIATLFRTGADAFRINMSHGDQASKIPVIAAIRAMEKTLGRPSTARSNALIESSKAKVSEISGLRSTRPEAIRAMARSYWWA